MGTLTSWAALEIGTGLAGSFTTTGTLRFFHQGNAAWNSVNLVLGIVGLVGQAKERRTPVDLAIGIQRARKAQLAFVINGALDVVYVGAGALSWGLAARAGSERFVGYGQALVLQGAFLFAFDFTMAAAHEAVLPRARGRGRLVLVPSPFGLAGRF
jgi:hypothetical protein